VRRSRGTRYDGSGGIGQGRLIREERSDGEKPRGPFLQVAAAYRRVKRVVASHRIFRHPNLEPQFVGVEYRGPHATVQVHAGDPNRVAFKRPQHRLQLATCKGAEEPLVNHTFGRLRPQRHRWSVPLGATHAEPPSGPPPVRHAPVIVAANGRPNVNHRQPQPPTGGEQRGCVGHDPPRRWFEPR